MADLELRTFLGDEGVALVADCYGASDRGTVLLAHGGGQTRHAWAKTGASLAAAGWRAVALDLRGHGDSARSPTGDYRMERFAADLVAVAAQLGDKPAVVGASLGGIAGMVVETLVAPETFSSLTLVDITPRMNPAGVAKIMGFMSEHVESGFASLEEAADVIARYLPNRARSKDLTGLSKNLRQDADGRYRWRWDPLFVTSVMHGRDGRSMDSFAASVSALRIPVHLIRGRMSELVSQDDVQEFLTLVPHAKFTDVENAGHMVAGDKNDVFVEAVLAFLDRPGPELPVGGRRVEV